MGTMTVTGATFISEFFENFHRMDKPLPGNTKTEAARQEAAFNGMQTGLRYGLAYYANELRREKVRALRLSDGDRRNWIPALLQSDFTAWLRSVRERWQAGEWKDAPDEAYMALMVEEFLSIVFDEEWNKYYDGLRKEAVMSGVIEPTADDLEWIAEEYKTYADMAKPYEKLLQKASDLKTRPVKNSPQA